MVGVVPLSAKRFLRSNYGEVIVRVEPDKLSVHALVTGTPPDVSFVELTGHRALKRVTEHSLGGDHFRRIVSIEVLVRTFAGVGASLHPGLLLLPELLQRLEMIDHLRHGPGVPSRRSIGIVAVIVSVGESKGIEVVQRETLVVMADDALPLGPCDERGCRAAPSNTAAEKDLGREHGLAIGGEFATRIGIEAPEHPRLYPVVDGVAAYAPKRGRFADGNDVLMGRGPPVSSHDAIGCDAGGDHSQPNGRTFSLDKTRG